MRVMSRDHDNRKSRRPMILAEKKKKMQGAMATNGYDGARSVNYQQRPQYQPQQAPRGWHTRAVQTLQRWGFLYNVTTGLYMLDWWERCLFNAVFLVFLFVACYNSGHYMSKFGAGVLAWCGDDASASLWLGGQHLLRTAFGALGGDDGDGGGGGARG